MLTLLTAVALALLALKLLVALAEPRMAFFPYRGEQATPHDLGIPYTDRSIRTADGETISAWWLQHPRARAVVIFWHGNGGNLSIWLDAIAGIYRQGLSVLAVDYRGYGKSTGSPTERGVYRDADAVLRQFKEERLGGTTPVIYWGRSLGGAVAAYAASIAPPDGLILESAFPDVPSLIAANPVMRVLGLFATYRFPAAEFLRGFTGPTLVMHGDRDTVIPYRQGQVLFRGLAGSKRFVTIAGSDHNDLHAADDERYWQPVREFIDEIVSHPHGS